MVDHNSSLFMEDCTLAHLALARSQTDLHYVLLTPHDIYFDYSSLSDSLNIIAGKKFICRALMALGLILHVFRVKINRRYLLPGIFIANTLLGLIEVADVLNRYSYDYTSYLQQSLAFYYGSTNYTTYSSSQGPCYYPAGHLYHYVVLNLIHMNTEHAEQIITLLHMFMHSFLLCLTIKISYIYFAEEKNKDKKEA